MDIETADALGMLGGEIRHVETALRGEMHTIRDELRGELGAGLAESRRHAEVLTESLRDDIRIVAEGVAVISEKLDALSR